jgi:hypothetical protein
MAWYNAIWFMNLLGLVLCIDPVDKNLQPCGDAWYLQSQVSGLSSIL